MKIIFFGTADFAVTSLDYMIQQGKEVVAVVSIPPKAAGRGLKMRQSPVAEYALENNLNLLQPNDLNDNVFIQELLLYNADLFAVVAFRKLPEAVWRIPPMGSINLHASLLPDYRGAAPINRVIMNGEKITGVTTFFINDRIDEGDMLLQEVMEISEDENAGELHDRLAEKGAVLLNDTISKLEHGGIEAKRQSMSQSIKKAPKLQKEDARIIWNGGAKQIHDHIRGLSPYPVAYCYLNNKVLKIYKSSFIHQKHNLQEGTIVSDNRSYLKVAAKDGFVFFHQLQLEGKKPMDVKAFMNGIDVNNFKNLD